MTIGDFHVQVARNLDGLIAELQRATGRSGTEEVMAWRISLSQLSKALSDDRLRNFHLHVDDALGLSVEYRLPASASWCDVVLLGRGRQAPAAVVLELKDWMTFGDEPGPRAALIKRHGQLALHPSAQVGAYVDYCRHFHSAVLDRQASVDGCGYFTRPGDLTAYRQEPHAGLVEQFPLFLEGATGVPEAFVQFLLDRLREPDAEFAGQFERGFYRQSRSFCLQLAEQLADPGSSPFVLLDHQRRGLEVCLEVVERALSNKSKKSKHVLVIEGPPGSGKSVVAARLWAELVRSGHAGVVITTTSAAQRTNWQCVIKGVRRGGEGIVIPATRYSPGDPKWVKEHRQRTPGDRMRAETWRENIATYQRIEGRLGPAREPLVSIVDEAHALINPESEKARAPSGFAVAFGPQAYHIIRGSRIAIFLMDAAQGFRERENTTVEEIEAWARELGAEVMPRVSLAGLQFRAGGSTEYVEWLEAMLEGRSPAPTSWRRTAASPAAPFAFEIAPDPLAVEQRLRNEIAEGSRARLLATYARPWRTVDANSPHDVPASEKDFHLPFIRNGKAMAWSRVWNWAPNGDYTFWVQGVPDGRMYFDPLSEVGCPYAVRGFDYDWTGILWLNDLVWRRDRWKVNLDCIHESGIKGALNAAKAEAAQGVEGPATAEVMRRTKQAYRIILTRALRGSVVWFEDEETREHVSKELGAAPQ